MSRCHVVVVLSNVFIDALKKCSCVVLPVNAVFLLGLRPLLPSLVYRTEVEIIKDSINTRTNFSREL